MTKIQFITKFSPSDFIQRIAEMGCLFGEHPPNGYFRFSCPLQNARLCADDVMSRTRLKEYQNTYAKQMARYGLQRGIEGSEAKHIALHSIIGKNSAADVDTTLLDGCRLWITLLKRAQQIAEIRTVAKSLLPTLQYSVNCLFLNQLTQTDDNLK